MDLIKEQVKIINQFFEIEKRLAAQPGAESLQRNLERIKNSFNEMGYSIHNPVDEPYNETRTDCEASISGESAENLFIEEVIKPIIRYVREGKPVILQKGVVIVKARY